MRNWSGVRTLVTGAGGFIGSHLVEGLLELGADVSAFVRYSSQNRPGFLDLLGSKKKDLRIIFGDIRDAEAVRGAVDGAEVIFHLAALVGIPYSCVHPVEVFDVNASGALNVLIAAKDANVRRVVMMSTVKFTGAPSTFQSTNSIRSSRFHLMLPAKSLRMPWRLVFTPPCAFPS